MTWNYHFLGDNLRFEYSRARLLESESEVDDLEYILIIMKNRNWINIKEIKSLILIYLIIDIKIKYFL